MSGFSGNQEQKFKQSNKIREIRFRIRNNGHEDALSVVVDVIVDGQTLNQFSIDTIDKQAVKNESRKLPFPDKTGKHTVEVQVNGGKLFPETRFDNNTKILGYEYLD